LTNIPNTASAIKERDFAKLSGDPDGYEGTIDTWMRNMDDVFPNYMTQYERDHPFKTAIPFTRGSANWWGGKFLPNLGFMVGGVAGAAVTDIAIGAVTEGIGEIPLIAAQLGKAALYLNKLFTSETQLNRVLSLGRQLGKTEQQLLNVKKLAELSAAAKVTNGFRYGMAVYGSAMTEAGVESRGAYTQVKDELTKQYIAENGVEPDFNAAQEIEDYATNAMNARFGINMALLTASNTLQFGSLFRSMTATKGITPQLDGIGKIGLAEGSLDTFEKQTAKTIAGKVWESVKPGVGNIFREGVFEEGGQFAAERGTYDYYTRKYKSDKYKNNWNDVNEVIKSTTFGMKEQFGSQEGIENMLIGGLTGLLIGKVQNIYENKKGIGQDAKTGNALNILNRFGVTNTLQRMYDDTVTQAGIVQDMQDAVKSKDVFKYKNFQADAFFNFVQSRVPYGMHEVTIEQLNMLKDLSKDQFEQMFQLDFNQTNKSTVNEYVDSLIGKANEIKKTSDAINQTFRNPFKNTPKEGDVESQIEADNYDTFEDYKLDLAYYASIAPDVNGRVSSVQQDINNIVPGLSTDLLSKLTDEEGLSSLSRMYEQKANQLNSTITELTSVQDKINIKNQVKALRTRSERIAMALGDNKITDKLFEDLLNFELNGQDATKENIVPLAQIQKLREYGFDVNRLSERKKKAADAYDKLSTKEGFEKYFEQAEEMAADKEAVAKEKEKEEKPEEKVEEKKEPLYKNKAGVDETLEKGREYQIPTAKVASVKKIADDRWEVSYPGGTTKFYNTEADAKLAAEDINDELGNLQKVKILDFNEDGSVKVENLKGDIFNIQPSRLSGYERLETKEEKFSKAAGDINRQQEEFEKKSGEVITDTGETTGVAINETKLKTAGEFFASSTGVSEAGEDISQTSPAVIRSRVFLNNVKNFKNRNKLRAILVTPNQLAGLGLSGLVQLQYNVPLTTPLEQIPNISDVDLGLVAQVFIEEDGGKLYFVDEKGERISEVNGQPTDMSRVIFKPMPTTSIYYDYKDANGNPVPRFRTGEKEVFQAYANSWKQVREQLFKAAAFPIKLYQFNVSRGVAKTNKINGEFERSQVGKSILPEDKIATQEGLIIIPKEAFITHQGKNIGWKKGNPAIQFGDTLEFINNTKLSPNKSKNVHQVIKALADDILKQYNAGKGIKLNAAYMTYLQNVLYLRKSGETAKGSNQFFIDTANMSISLGGEVYKLDAIDEKKMVEQLKNTFHNLNSFTLKDEFYSPFYEYVYEDGSLKEIEWKNYQSYLLSSKYPDGKARGIAETPYLTNVVPPTKAVPYSFEQKYSTLTDFDFPPVEMPKAQPSPTGAPMIGEYDMGGEVVNTYPATIGPIDFTGEVTKQDGRDVINVDVKDNSTVTKLSEDSEFVEQTVIPTLKGIVDKDGKSSFDPADDDVTLVKKWAALRVMGQLYKMKEEAPASQAAVLQPNVTPLAQAQGTARTEPVITAAPVVTDTKATKRFDVNDAAPPSDDYMRVGINEDDAPMTDAELELFKEWHAEKTPGIPFEVLDNIVTTHDNEKAFGVFENGVAKFYKGAPGTTPYHEVGEGIWKAFLTPEQRQLILDEFKAKAGQFTDRASGKKIYYADATDQQAKERIWDDFAEFRAGKIKAKSLGERVVAFFRNIIEFFKQFVQKPSMKEQLFKAIEAGKFKEFKVPERVRTDAPEYMRVPGLTETQVYDFVQDMVIRAGRIMFGSNKEFVFKLNPVTGKQIFDTIEQEYIKENKRQQFSDDAWRMLKKRTVDSLRTIGINYSEEDLVNINSEGTSGRDYSPEPFSTNWKKSSPFPIKFLAFITPKAKPTNQQNSTSLRLPERETTTSVLGLKMAGYGRIMATLFNKLSNTTNPKLMNKKLVELAKYDADFVRFYQYMGGTIAKGEDNAPAGIDFSRFEAVDWRLYIQFFQTFSLQRPEALVQYKTGSQVYTQPANQFTAATEIVYKWYEAIKTLSKSPDSIVKYNREKKTYIIDENVYPTTLPRELDPELKFLKDLGVDFGIDDYTNLQKEDRNKFTAIVGSIHTYLKEMKEVGRVSGKELGINSQLTALANLLITSTNPIQDSTYPGVDGTRQQSLTQNNYMSVFENEFNDANTLEELVGNRPELQDVFSKNSVVLMNNGLFYNDAGERFKLLKVSYIQGERNNDNNSGETTSSLSMGDRMTQEINQNLEGYYYVLLPADSSTEWMLNLGNYITFTDIASNRAFDRLYKVFKGYLIDDINLALDWNNRSNLRNVGNKAKELRFFKDILSRYDKDGNIVPSAVLIEINKRIEEGQSIDQITEYISDKDVAAKINELVKESVEENVSRTREALVRENQLKTLSKKKQEDADVYSYPKLDNTFTGKKNVLLNKFKLSNEDVNNILTFARMNYMIANIEFHKILFGDPYQFKIKNNMLDETKRIKSFGSPRRVTFDVPEYNVKLNEVYNKAGEIDLDPEELGYHLHKDYVNTITVEDIEFSSSNYSEVNEADADSWIMDNAYRELKLKNAQWPPEAEAFHQWQMAYTRQNLPGYTYKNESLRKQDQELLKKPEPKFVIEKLKPVGTGNKAASTNIDLILDKYAQLPIYYKAVQGRNLGKLYEKMWREKVDYAVMISGRKVGAEELQKFYKDNEFNETPFTNFIKVPWKAIGIQVENSYENPKDQTWGSQPAKISSMDLFDNGKETIPGARAAYDAYINATKNYHSNKYQQLLKKLGLEDLGDGFRLVDPVAIAQTLEGEFFRQQLSENVKYSIQLDENKQFNIPFEASTNYTQIKNILYSMVNKALVSPKLNGGPKAMSSVTLWEKGKRDPNTPNPALKFYTKDDPYIEILLPYKYKSKFNKRKFPTDESILEYLNNTPEGKQIIQGVAFRVPTDAQNKIDTYRIAGFLPEFMGDVVIVPSELTAKAGLDFDFDKMSTYLKSIYVDKNGNVRLVKNLGSEEATKEFFGKVFDDRLEKKKVSKAEILEALQILDLGLEDTNNLVDRYADLLDILLEDATPEERADVLLKELEKLGDANLQASLKDRYIDDMYNRALENDYIQALENMLTLPGTLERRLIPTDDAGLKKEAAELNELRGKNNENIKNRLLDGTYMTSLRHAFITGKAWIGIVATNITSHSLSQKTIVTLDPSRVAQLPDWERKILGDGRMVLPHNTAKVNGVDRISLSGTKTADGKNQYISYRLAGYGTSVLDISKDPYIIDIIYSDLLIGPTMFLERIGSGSYIRSFINQPIVRKYISYIESKGEGGLFSEKNFTNVTAFFPTTSSALKSVDVDINNFNNNIETYAKGKLTTEQNAEQHKILREFLRYAMMARYSFYMTQAINYDTSKSRNSDSFSRKQTKTGIAQQRNIFCCPEDILNASFIGNQRDLIDFIMSSMGEIMKTEKDEFRIITDTVLKPYEEVAFMKDEDFDRVAGKLKASFIDFIIQTKLKLNEELSALTLGSDSVASQLEQAKKKYPKLQLLKDLQVVSSDREGGAQSIKTRVKITDPVDINMYTELMRELNDADPQLFNNIVKIAIIQGTSNSSISIRNIIPEESYSALIKPVIYALAPTLDVQDFAKNGSFQRNNWKDDSVVPVAKVVFRMDENILPGEDQYGNEYYKYMSPSFIPIPGLGILSGDDRRLMIVSPKYNASDIQYDFIKIRKITTVNKDTGEKVDVETGLSITDANINARRNSGDLSIDDVYGYQKVRDGLGNPVTTPNGSYVYKLVNLWGDGALATEHYADNRRSIYNNGTVQIDNEIPTEDIINYYGPVVKAEKEVVPLEPAPQTYTPEEQLEAEIIDITQKIEVLEEAQQDVNESSIEMIVLNNLVKITPESAKNETGLKTGTSLDISLSFLSNKGVSVEKAAEIVWQEYFIDTDIDSQDVRNIIVDILSSGSKSNYIAQFAGSREVNSLKQQLKGLKEDLAALRKGAIEPVVPSGQGLSTASGKLKLKDGKEYLISDINTQLLESIGYKPKDIGKLLKSIC
jgi:hypothetical protein